MADLFGYSVLNQNGENKFEFRNVAKQAAEKTNLIIINKYPNGGAKREVWLIQDVRENVRGDWMIEAVKTFGSRVRSKMFYFHEDVKVSVMSDAVYMY